MSYPAIPVQPIAEQKTSWLSRWLLALGLALLLSLTSINPAQAASSLAFGYDLARQLDKNQDDGQVNLNFQFATGRRSALVMEFGKGDRYQMYELAFKRYNEKFLSGSYFQLGLDYWHGKSSKNAKSKLGLDVRTGYEIPLSPNFVAFGAVSLVYGPNNTITNESKELLFRPHLGIRWHF